MRHSIFLWCFLILFACREAEQNKAEGLEANARKIHENTTTIDTHIDIDVKNFTVEKNYKQRLETQVDLPKLKEGGLDVSWLIVYTGQDSLNVNGYRKAKENAMAKFEAIHRLCNELAKDDIALALNSEDIRRIIASGKKVAMIGVENAYPIGEDLSEFQKYHEMGARYISLSHNGHSQFCDSNTGEKDGIWLHDGLSELGEKAITEMNRLGIMIDVSHPSKKAMEQMIQLSKAPIIASHSSARSLCDHSRNLDDEQLKLMQENGGVVQTVAFSAYLKTKKHDARASYMKNIYLKVADSLGIDWYERDQWATLTETELANFRANRLKVREIAETIAKKDTSAPPAVNVGDFIDHVDYMVDLIGIDHVGISSDFDGGGGIEGWKDASETFNVTLELVRRGYTEEEIAKLWGGNLMRVLDKVQAVADSLQKT